MVIDIKMCRFDNVPWGFRLVGGSDFEYPLTVVKVTEGSIAEEAGLKVGDVIVRINDTATSPLTHDETNKIIKSCGNVFYFGVFRENEDEVNEKPLTHFPVKEKVSLSPEFERGYTKSPQSDAYHEELNGEPEVENEGDNDLKKCDVDEEEHREPCLHQVEDRPCSVLSENTEIKMVEEEIAAVLSGESEVLKEHNNVMGIFPKPGVCMSSDVLRSLNEEAIKTKAEKDKENKKWSTFLQKPNRPIPKSKQQIEAERRAANAYRVKIARSPISKECTPPPLSFTSQTNLSPDQAVRPLADEKKSSDAEEKKDENKENISPSDAKDKDSREEEEDGPTPADNELPDLEALKDNNSTLNEPSEDNVANEIEKSDKEKEISLNGQNQKGTSSPSMSDAQTNEDLLETTTTENENSTKDSSNEMITSKVEKTEEELALERQLAEVQKQLAALSSLPSTIQSTLDSVTKQLAELLPAFKLQQDQQQAQNELNTIRIEKEPRQINLEKIEENSNETKEVGLSFPSGANSARASENKHNDNVEENVGNGTDDGHGDADDEINDMEVASFEGQHQQKPMNERDNLIEIGNDTQNMKKQKKSDVIGELEEHLERKKNPKRSKRAFGPLTPSSERPLVLPGGRRWYRPKDAYNDEFIAETLSAQAELITGTTLGVNFMKYQKPERKIDLNRSEVYKVIHHLDRQPIRGIEVRPSIVPAEADIRKAIHS